MSSDDSLRREVTPPEMYFNRRAFMRAGLVGAGAVATAGLYRALNGASMDAGATTPAIAGVLAATGDAARQRGFRVEETPTPFASVTHYNNFYEFTTDKDGVARAAERFRTTDWRVEVSGLVHEPRTFDMDDIRRISAPEERIYRFRCVEAWSMVVPWIGYSLSRLLDRVRPTSAARYVAFETLHDPARMPGQNTGVLPWPYQEGLRLDEAMHPLALLTTGLYGHELPPQDGAPVRVIVPWKYGFKSIKSIVKIQLVAMQPPTTWSRQAPGEYGFFANVNPAVPHPRWSQATEQRIGESGRRATLPFNGYADQVASLYTGMDLHAHY